MNTTARAPLLPRVIFFLVLSAVAVLAAALADPAGSSQRWPEAANRIPAAILVNTLFGLAALRARTVTSGGAIAGGAIACIVATAAGWPAWWLLGVGFLLTVTTTAVGRKRKAAAGIGEDRKGRRAAGNIIANTGVAAASALLAAIGPDETFARLALAAALATSVSDTVSTEIGKAFGGRTWSLTSLRSVAPGTTGAVSLEGLAAGVLAASGLAVAAYVLGVIEIETVVPVAMAAVIASMVEGAIGATLEPRGVLDNDGVNLLNSLLGATLAVAAVVGFSAG